MSNHVESPVSCDKKFNFYSKSNRKSSEESEKKRLVFLTDHPGCYVENRLKNARMKD